MHATMTTNEERAELLEEAVSLIERAAEVLELEFREDEYLRRTVGAQLQGRDHGWMGDFVIDALRDRLHAVRGGEDPDA